MRSRLVGTCIFAILFLICPRLSFADSYEYTFSAYFPIGAAGPYTDSFEVITPILTSAPRFFAGQDFTSCGVVNGAGTPVGSCYFVGFNELTGGPVPFDSIVLLTTYLPEEVFFYYPAGTFASLGTFTSNSSGEPNGVLVITQLSEPVPEPSSLLLLLIGMAGLYLAVMAKHSGSRVKLRTHS